MSQSRPQFTSRRFLYCQFLVAIFANMTIHQKITRLSCDFAPTGQLYRVWRQERGVGIDHEEERILREK